MKRTALLTASLLFALPLLAGAEAPRALFQTTAQRKVDQQRRIQQGARSGQLTPRETAHLEHQERGINREERAMRAQNNGHLTRGDRSVLRAQQNQESRRIYNDKHNLRTDPGVPPAAR